VANRYLLILLIVKKFRNDSSFIFGFLELLKKRG